MKIGTKSLLFGAHQFIIHPLYVWLAWRRLYPDHYAPRWRDRWNWRIAVCIVVHDWGYWGLPDMDGTAGELHPEGGARLAGWLCALGTKDRELHYRHWYWHCAAHSRTYAKRLDVPASQLMRADKLATALYPLWLYALLVWLSGEYREYRDRWVAAGTYPGRANDGPLAYCRHLQANWARFRDLSAPEGRAYGHE